MTTSTRYKIQQQQQQQQDTTLHIIYGWSAIFLLYVILPFVSERDFVVINVLFFLAVLWF